MIKVKTFGEPLQIFRAHRELDELDARINQFIQQNRIANVISVSDSPTSENGTVIGLIRVLVYDDGA